jgi:hypothetical protein
MPSLCQTLQKEYQELEKLKQKFDTAFFEAVKTNDTSEIKRLRKEIEEKITQVKEKIIPKEIKAIFKNPETNQEKEIVFNLRERIKESQVFYQKFNLPVPDEKEIRAIWRKNYKEIQKEMETYGYDEMLIIPENLPNTESLNQTLIESMPNTTATYQSNIFKKGNGFSGAKHTEKTKTKIIFCHQDQNIHENEKANIFNKQTLGKNILQLSGLDQAELERRVQNQENIPINFETEINGQKILIQSEGLSLNEYLIFQRQYFEKTNNHLDEKGWTWLLKTFSASRVVVSSWNPDNRQLSVRAYDLGLSADYLACRLSRSFEN